MPDNHWYLPSTRPLTYNQAYSAQPALPSYGSTPPPYNPAYDATFQAPQEYSTLPILAATSTAEPAQLFETDSCSLAQCLEYEAFRSDDPQEKPARKLGRLTLYSVAVPVKLVSVAPIAAVTATLCFIPAVTVYSISDSSCHSAPDKACHTMANSALVLAKGLGLIAGTPLGAICCGLRTVGTACQPANDTPLLDSPAAPGQQNMS